MAQNDTRDTGALPDGWANVRVRDVFAVHYGKGLTQINRDESGQVPVYGSSGIVGYHTEALVHSPCVIIGRKGASGEAHYSKVPCWPIDTTYYICPPDGFSTEYLYYLLYSLDLGTLDKSTTIPSLSRDDFSAQVLAIAPLPEQHRIVAEIETQFTRLEAGVTALKRAQANLRRYRAAVLKAAFEGRLLPGDEVRAIRESPEYEPADTLLQRILAERRDRWEADNPGKKYQAPTPPDTSDLPALPEGWVWASLDELTCHITSGSRGWAEYYSDTGSVFIRAQDINTDELVLDNVAHVELPESTEGQRTRVFKDDLLVTITGANVTKTALIRQGLDEAT